MRRKRRRTVTGCPGGARCCGTREHRVDRNHEAVRGRHHPDYETKPLLSVGDQVPETSNPSKRYQMVGIPDGLGAHKSPGGTITLFMNHELLQTAQSRPVIGEPLNRGAIISKLTLDKDGKVLQRRACI